MKEVISKCKSALRTMQNKQTLWDDDERVVEIYSILFDAYWQDIHKNLLAGKQKDSEKQIRTYVRDVINTVLQPISAKITKCKPPKSKGHKFLKQYLDLYDDFFSIAALRSLKHFALYMEFDRDDKEKVWKYAMPCFESYFYYKNKQILDGEVKRIIKQFPTGYGKCMLPSTLVRTPNGISTLADIQVGDEVYSMKDNRLVVQKVLNKWYSQKTQVKITTRGGIEVTVSPEHRLYTQKGYIQAKDLTIDDYLYRLCATVEEGVAQDDDELAFATYMLFDGCCLHNHKSFTKPDGLVLNEFVEVCDRLGIEHTLLNNSKLGAKEIYLRNGKADDILKKYEIIDHLSKTKKLSNKFLELPIRQRFNFIGRMLATDGYIPNGKPNSQCGITLASKELIIGIQSLLNSCGIYSSICQKKAINRGKQFNAYMLSIPNEYLPIIAQNCYCYDKQIRLDNRMAILSSYTTKPYSNSTNYPKSAVQDCKEFRQYTNKSFASTKSFKKEKVEKFARETGLLQDIIYHDFVYDSIKNIEIINEKVDMIDIEVSDTHNFIANDIVSHNSYSDAMAIAWTLGIENFTADILKVVGNPALVSTTMVTVTGIMCSARYAKVFPYYAQFDGDSDKMFKICKIEQGALLVEGSTKPMSMRVLSKDTKIDGGRFKYRYYDDVTASDDMDKVAAHDKDWDRYIKQWRKRQYDENRSFEDFGGTAYSIYDFISKAKEKFGIKDAIPSKFKWTKINPETKTVFIAVPKLDWDTDESTYPEKYSTAEARADRADDEKTFMAMEQQTPLAPQGTPFYWDNLILYETLPEKDGENRQTFCRAALDLPRSGKNYCSFNIYSPAKNCDYFIDTIYQKKPLDGIMEDGRELLDHIIDKIIKHNVIRMCVETNTNSTIVSTIEKRLQARKYFNCIIEPIYSVENKEERIYKQQATILKRIAFPARQIFAESSDMGQSMRHFVCYTYNGKFDDGIDTHAMYSDKYLTNSSDDVGAKVVILRRRNG